MVEDTNVQENEAKQPEVTAKSGDSEPKAAFSIDILRLIRNAQKQHGLRHGDYQRYRGLCFVFNIVRDFFLLKQFSSNETSKVANFSYIFNFYYYKNHK